MPLSLSPPLLSTTEGEISNREEKSSIEISEV